MTGLATDILRIRPLRLQLRVRRRDEILGDIPVAIRAVLRSNEMGARNRRGCDDNAIDLRACDEQNYRKQRHRQWQEGPPLCFQKTRKLILRHALTLSQRCKTYSALFRKRNSA